jgi:dihydroxyacid dehydratase/phosphogluconate dehydratase
MEAKTNLKENAAAVVAASGGSTNAALHLPAIAHECGIAFDLFDVAEVFKRTPYIADLKPAGRFVAKDLFEAGGVPLLMKTLLDNGFMHGDCMTVTGYGMAENLKRVAWNSDQEVVCPADRPLTATGVVGLRGNLAPEGAIVKVAGMDNGSEAAVGGPIGLVRDGDIIAIDADRGNLEVQLSDVEFEKRRAAWQPRGSAFESGYLWKYAQQVGSARHGAVTHPGGAAEKACYADI